MEALLNGRLNELKKIHKKAIANKNFTFAMIIDNHIDEVKAIMYLFKRQINNYDQIKEA